MRRVHDTLVSVGLALPFVVSSRIVAGATAMDYLPWSTVAFCARGSVVTFSKQTYYALASNGNRTPMLNLNTTWRHIGTNLEYKGDWTQQANPPTLAAPSCFTGAATRDAGNLYLSKSDNNLTLLIYSSS
jgi:hypothetical protein